MCEMKLFIHFQNPADSILHFTKYALTMLVAWCALRYLMHFIVHYVLFNDCENQNYYLILKSIKWYYFVWYSYRILLMQSFEASLLWNRSKKYDDKNNNNFHCMYGSFLIMILFQANIVSKFEMVIILNISLGLHSCRSFRVSRECCL